MSDEKTSRTPHGVRGLKSTEESPLALVVAGRTPHGVRGLKSEGRHRNRRRV